MLSDDWKASKAEPCDGIHCLLGKMILYYKRVAKNGKKNLTADEEAFENEQAIQPFNHLSKFNCI